MIKINAPYGAVTSKEFLALLVARAQKGEQITLYRGYGLGARSFISEIVLDQSCYLENDCLYTLHTNEYGKSWTSTANLGDMNIGANHNHNYIFLEKEFAEDFIQFVMTNKALCDEERARAAYFNEVWAEFDRDLDWDDTDWDDDYCWGEDDGE